MRVISTTLISIIILTKVGFCQDSSKVPITTKKAPLMGYFYYKMDKKLSISKLNGILAETPATQIELDKAKQNYMLGLVLSIPGGYMIGYPLGQTIAGGKSMNWSMFLIGVALGTVSTIFENKAHNNYLNAVKIYNAELP